MNKVGIDKDQMRVAQEKELATKEKIDLDKANPGMTDKKMHGVELDKRAEMTPAPMQKHHLADSNKKMDKDKFKKISFGKKNSFWENANDPSIFDM